MKRALLDALLSHREAKRAAVVLTDLGDGRQAMWTPDGGATGLSDLGYDAPALEEAAQEALRTDKSRTVEIGDRQVFVQVFNPPKRMIVVGAVHISQILAPMAAMTGYDVTVIDPRTAWATAERFPGVTIDQHWPDEAMQALAPDSRTAVVTLTHDPKIDDPALEAALASPAFYIGALGSKRTHARRVERLKEAGLSDEAIARIHAPIGLDIGAISPAEIAVAVLGQVTVTLRGPKGR